MVTSTLSKATTKQAQIKAPAPVVNGKRSGIPTVVADVNVIPLMPASSEIVNRLALNTPTRLLVTYTQVNQDVTFLEGYTLTLDGVDYPIRAANRWPWLNREQSFTYELVIEDLQNR